MELIKLKMSDCRWVEMMAPVFSKAAWRCVWYMIQARYYVYCTNYFVHSTPPYPPFILGLRMGLEHGFIRMKLDYIAHQFHYFFRKLLTDMVLNNVTELVWNSNAKR